MQLQIALISLGHGTSQTIVCVLRTHLITNTTLNTNGHWRIGFSVELSGK